MGCCASMGRLHRHLAREAEFGISHKRSLIQRRLSKRQITANGVQEGSASLQQQSVEFYAKNLIIPARLIGKVGHFDQLVSHRTH